MGSIDQKVANRNVRDFGWERAHEAVSRRPPISLDTVVARTHIYTYDATVWGLCIVHGPFLSTQTLYVTIRNFCIAVLLQNGQMVLYAPPWKLRPGTFCQPSSCAGSALPWRNDALCAGAWFSSVDAPPAVCPSYSLHRRRRRLPSLGALSLRHAVLE